MIEIKNKEDCCGCNACGDICPKKAITFVRDMEGFLYPKVNKGLCVNCHLCEKTCPMLHIGELKSKMVNDAKSYAAISKDIEARYDSTSGGMYSVLAEYILKDGGFIGGAIWNGDFSISQIVTNKPDDLPRLRSSKYAQSDATGFFAAVKSALGTGKKVLVCGTPCQMAALRLFIGKPVDNLFVVDFICRGSNSPLIMRKYIEMMEKKHGSKVIAIKMKSKELGWRRLTTKFTFENGDVEYDPKERSLYMRGYLISDAFCRASCYQCRFKDFPRVADITLGDCWHVADSLKSTLDDNAGTSVVICNTTKGALLFEAMKDSVVMQPVPTGEIVKGNPMLMVSLPRPRISREEIYRQIKTSGFDVTMQDMLSHVSFRTRLKKQAKRWAKRIYRTKGNLLKLIWTNDILKLLSGKNLIIPYGRFILKRERNSVLSLDDDIMIGLSKYSRSRQESRLLICENAKFSSGFAMISHGCDIQVFKGATLELGEKFSSNIGLEISCGESIKIGRDVMCARHVLIRDTNGGHTIASKTFKRTDPVRIGDHVWLCDRCMVMPGVTIGSGSVVAAGSIVTHDVPPNSLVAGIPARLVRKNVIWKE